MRYAVLMVALPVAVLASCTKKGGDRAAPHEEPTTQSSKDPGSEGSGGGGRTGSGEPIVGGRKGSVDLDAILGGDLEISVGSMGKDAVRKVMKDHVSKLQYCYEQTLLANPGIEGRVMAKFTIEPQGSVADVKCEGVHPDVEACVEKAVKDMKFPPGSGKVEVLYPFTFKPA